MGRELWLDGLIYVSFGCVSARTERAVRRLDAEARTAIWRCGLLATQAGTGSLFLRAGLAGSGSSTGRGADRNSTLPTTL
jgi:hypothetical protein